MTNDRWLSKLLCEHENAVIGLAVRRMTYRGRKAAERRLRSLNRRVFKFITDRNPTPQELDACTTMTEVSK